MTVDLQPAHLNRDTNTDTNTDPNTDPNTELTFLSPAADPFPADEKSAVDRCKDAYELTKAQMKANGRGDCACILAANKAFRNAMPTLETASSTRDFIACVTQGMIIGAITGTHGTRLLYAAQVARPGFHPLASPPKSRR